MPMGANDSLKLTPIKAHMKPANWRVEPEINTGKTVYEAWQEYVEGLIPGIYGRGVALHLLMWREWKKHHEYFLFLFPNDSKIALEKCKRVLSGLHFLTTITTTMVLVAFFYNYDVSYCAENSFMIIMDCSYL